MKGKLLLKIWLTTILWVGLTSAFYVYANPPEPFDNHQNRPLIEVLREMSETYQVFLSFDESMLDHLEVDFTIDKEENFERSINRLLKDTGLEYKYLGRNFYVIYKNDRKGKRQLVKLQKNLQKIQELESAGNLSLEYANKNGLKRIENIQKAVLNWKLKDKTISGRVINESGEPLIGATVRATGTTQGTLTDNNGRFQLVIPDDVNTLLISYIGYQEQEVDITGQTEVTVTMSESTSSLEEVVVIGYGQKERQAITTDISTVDAETIERSQAMQTELALQGRIPGVLVTQPGGDPNSRVNIQIQGIGSFGNNDPLIVIDGIPITEFGSESQDAINPAAANDLRGSQNVLNLINPNDIESISVLKDASAAAIYGFRAANGVILITTKRGSVGRTTVRLNAQRGIQNLPDTYDVLNTQDYTALYQEMFNNNPNAQAIPPEFDPSSPFFLGNSETFDAQDAMLNENAINESYHLNVSGGSVNGNYAINAGYTFIESPLKANDQQRYTFGINSDYKANNWIRFGETFRAGYTDGYDNRSGNLLAYALQTPPWQPYEDPSQPLGLAPTALTRYNPNGMAWEFDTLSDGRTGLLYGPETEANHLAQSNSILNGRRFDVYRTIGSAYLELEPIEGLRLRGQYSADWYLTKRTTWNYPQLTLQYSITGNAQAPAPDGVYSSYAERHSQNLNQVLDVTLNFDRTFGNHKVGFLAGYNEQQERYFLITGSTQQVLAEDPLTELFETEQDLQDALDDPRDYRPPFQLGGATPENANTSSLRYRNRYQGVIGRASYSFADKVFVDASIRFDGSSKFAPGFRWGTFPAASAAWRISEEAFMSSVSWVDELKIRAGWGQVGNNQVARPNEWRENISQAPKYTIGPGPGGDATAGQGAFVPNFASTDLTWEKENTTNIAVSGQLFNRLVSFDIGYYNRLRDGVLQQVALPSVVGNTQNPTLNTAKTRNQGIQVELGFTPTVGEVRFNISANLTTVHNRVLEVFSDQPFGGNGGRVEEGQPMFFIWGLETNGIFQSQEEINAWLQDFDDPGNNDKAPGDIIFVDQFGNPTEEDVIAGRLVNPNPDSVINQFDNVFLGNTIPAVFGGLNIDIQWRGFDMSVFFQGVGDFQRINNARWAGEGMGGLGNNYWTTVQDRWTPQNTDTDIPRAVAEDPGGNNRFSDRWVENAGFIRLRQAQIGYSFSPRIREILGNMTQLRLYVAGSNLATFTGWSGIDPENDEVPVPRILSVGVNMAF